MGFDRSFVTVFLSFNPDLMSVKSADRSEVGVCKFNEGGGGGGGGGGGPL